MQPNEVMSDYPLFSLTNVPLACSESRLPISISIERTELSVLRCFTLNAAPQINPHQVAQIDPTMRGVQFAREEEEESRRGGEEGEVSLATEVMRPHRHKDDKDTSGWLSSFKSCRVDHHTVNPH